MCKEHIYTDMMADGRLQPRPVLMTCSRSRDGYPCDRTKTYNHDPFPPTPPLSSHSGHASDSSDRSSRRRSGIYIGDTKYLDISKKRSSRHERHNSGDRLSFEDYSPISTSPLSRSPRRSPTVEVFEERLSSRRSHEDGPTSSHRPNINIEIIESKGHSRKTSSSKTSSTTTDEEERRRRRRSSVHFAPDTIQHERQSKIDRANEVIANRLTRPSSNYRRPSVSIDPVISATERLALQEEHDRKERKKHAKMVERQRERETDEMKQRLKARQTLYH
ncbi:hypothetical protein F5Y16DRAFT_392022 [Xylariaceae sp. FL0255]|nr:hypothetical protein F5Y16DRAFT_392022 [Xylariaceae sp. FL0255]